MKISKETKLTVLGVVLAVFSFMLLICAGVLQSKILVALGLSLAAAMVAALGLSLCIIGNKYD